MTIAISVNLWVFKVQLKSFIYWTVGQWKICDIVKQFGNPQNSLSVILKTLNGISELQWRLKSTEPYLPALKYYKFKKIPINRPILKEKAKHFANFLNKPNFESGKRSVHWFKDRHAIVLKTNYCEASEVDETVGLIGWMLPKNWTLTVQAVINCTDLVLVIKMMGEIFYHLLPEKTFAIKMWKMYWRCMIRSRS